MEQIMKYVMTILFISLIICIVLDCIAGSRNRKKKVSELKVGDFYYCGFNWGDPYKEVIFIIRIISIKGNFLEFMYSDGSTNSKESCWFIDDWFRYKDEIGLGLTDRCLNDCMQQMNGFIEIDKMFVLKCHECIMSGGHCGHIDRDELAFYDCETLQSFRDSFNNN